MEINILKQLGMRVRFLRKQKNYSIEHLALESNINKNYLSDLERGTRNPTIKILSRLCVALECDLSYLCQGIAINSEQ